MKKVDANDVLRDVGPAGLRELIDKTPPKDLAAFNIVEAKPINLKSLRAFVAEYQPPSYVVEPIIRSGSLYTLTGKTGGGKTGLLVSTTLAVATGRQDILKFEAVKGRVAYLTAENPDDVRMRFMVSGFVLNVGIDGIAERVVILDRREKPEDIVAGVTKFAEEEPFALIIVDTLAAFYDGKDINSSVEGGEFLRRLRPLPRIKGSPAVVVEPPGQERRPEPADPLRQRRDPQRGRRQPHMLEAAGDRPRLRALAGQAARTRIRADHLPHRYRRLAGRPRRQGSAGPNAYADSEFGTGSRGPRARRSQSRPRPPSGNDRAPYQTQREWG